LVGILSESQRQSKNATCKLIMHGSKVVDLVALKAPYWLSVAILKVQGNANGDMGRAGSQGRVFRFGLDRGMAGRVGLLARVSHARVRLFRGIRCFFEGGFDQLLLLLLLFLLL
jgi:hypothetical protein